MTADNDSAEQEAFCSADELKEQEKPAFSERHSWQRRLPALLDRLSILDVDFEIKFPEDVYSIIYLTPWRSFAFWYSVAVFLLQMLVLALVFSDMVYDLPGTEEDNKLNVPPTATTQVFIAQFVALFIAVLSQEDVTLSLMLISVSLAEEYPTYQSTLQQKYPHAASSWQFWLANCLRLTEGVSTLLVSFIFIIQSATVLEIFLNFAAIQFVSELDNLGHRLAQEGWFGYPLRMLAKRMKEEAIPIKKARNPIIDFVNRTLLLAFIAAMFACNVAVVYRQSNGYYVKKEHCSVLEVRLEAGHYNFPPGAKLQTEKRGEDERLFFANSNRPLPSQINPSDPPDLVYSTFSGKYEADFHNKGKITNPRPIYYESSKNPFAPSKPWDDSTVGFFYYCERENAWVWSVKAFVDAGAVPKETLDRCAYGWLLISPITQAVTLEETPKFGWRAWTGVLRLAASVSFTCMQCKSDIDCGLNRGTCGDDNLCHCHDHAGGTFCNDDYACSILMLRHDEREFGPYYSYPNFEAYGRPIFAGPVAGGDYDFFSYTGTRWIKALVTASQLEVLLQENLEMHAYWYSSQMRHNFWYSSNTDNFLPTGTLKWYSVDRNTRSEGSYGLYGRMIQINARVECLSVNCKASTHICGSFGRCLDNQTLTIEGKPVKRSSLSNELAAGGKCSCNDTNYGHFCEFSNQTDPRGMASNSTLDEL